MRTVLLAGIYHETHTFLQQKTGLDAFEQMALNQGDAVISNNLGNGSPTDGFISHAQAEGWSIIPTIQMAAMPSGTVEQAAIDLFRSKLFAGLEQHVDKLDGIYLVLHGAMVSVDIDDVEGEILAEVQAFLKRAKRNIPVAGVIDLHANVSAKMLENSDCLVSYRENPHTDARQAAVRGAELLGNLMDRPDVTQVHLATKYVFPPTGLGTSSNPMKAALAQARAIEAADSEILCINVMGGYAYADIADCGYSLNCCTRGDRAKAMGYLEQILKTTESWLKEAYPAERNLDAVLADIDADPPADGPILLIEAADNIGGGTPGDATGILAPLLATGRRGIIAIINDPAAAQLCHKSKPGQSVTLSIGGKIDRHHGEPMPFTGTIESLSDGAFELENRRSHLASMMGTHIEMGPCAVLRNEQAIVLVTSRKTPPMDLGQLHSQGINVEKARYVVVKAAVSHREAYDPIAVRSYNVDSPGLCTSDLRRLPFEKLSGKQISL
ncbi:M81 family metallopeptidase [Devosia rhodophyticola]|uniref:Microcystinase C n=1 Tax=Devosia rhodophyticola TaxID=3026423 RepID=A0ABY7YXV1_9HYPH|nr:M81 family metallopeptidase [Devosia rhodophyticola]WDR06186.1 M81 family metallopeptidase [Devosia rhodophyticola]